jgi:hypothetical protein
MVGDELLAGILVIAGVFLFVAAAIIHWIFVIIAIALVILGIYVLAGGSIGGL